MKLNIQQSQLTPHLRWNVDWTLECGVAHWLRGPNGIGKTSLLDELKCQWPQLQPEKNVGFTDQAPLDPFQDLTVAQVFDLLWEIAPARRMTSRWQELPDWDAEAKALWNRPVKLLSGGENQWIKILMMRSLHSQVWLLDEPFQFLDQRRNTQLQNWLQEWIQAGNFLILTHHGELTLAKVKPWTLRPSSEGLKVEEAP